MSKLEHSKGFFGRLLLDAKGTVDVLTGHLLPSTLLRFFQRARCYKLKLFVATQDNLSG